MIGAGSRYRGSRRIGVLGAGGQAVETAGYIRDLGWEVAFYFVDPFQAPKVMPDAPCIGRDDDLTPYADLPVTSAVGSPLARRTLVSAWPGTQFLNLVAGLSWISEGVDVGQDVTVAPGVLVNRCARIGHHVLLNLASTVSHETLVGDFVTISPGCRVAGRVKIGDGAFLSIGSVIGPDVVVGEGAVVGAGAVVIHDVAPHAVVAGVPAREIKHLSDWS